jgi:DNA primase
MILPDYIIDFFNRRKITKEVLDEFSINWNGTHIVYPVKNINGEIIFSNYRRSPISNVGARFLYDKGSKVSLYGIDKISKHKTILICEGLNDCLVAWSHNIPAVSSTGGSQSFQKEWVDYFIDKDVIICFDNDEAGAEGMVKALKIIPWAKILLLPYMPNVKDISDYVTHGGNLIELMKTAQHYNFLEEVTGDRLKRLALCQSVYFHDAYIKEHTKVNKHTERKTYSNDKVTNAKLYPMTNLLEFKGNKCCCPFHSEKTASFQYYPETNTAYCFGCGKVADSIEVYRHIHPNKSFKECVEDLNKLI